MFLEKGFPEIAISDFNQAIDLTADFANRADVYCQRWTRAFVMLDNYSKAVQDCGQAIRLDPDFPTAYYYQGVAHVKGGSLDRAAADLAEAVALDPELEAPSQPWLAEICRGRGLVHLAEKEWDAAIADLRSAIRIEPKWSRPLGFQLAIAYHVTRRF